MNIQTFQLIMKNKSKIEYLITEEKIPIQNVATKKNLLLSSLHYPSITPNQPKKTVWFYRVLAEQLRSISIVAIQQLKNHFARLKQLALAFLLSRIRDNFSEQLEVLFEMVKIQNIRPYQNRLCSKMKIPVSKRCVKIFSI